MDGIERKDHIKHGIEVEGWDENEQLLDWLLPSLASSTSVIAITNIS